MIGDGHQVGLGELLDEVGHEMDPSISMQALGNPLDEFPADCRWFQPETTLPKGGSPVRSLRMSEGIRHVYNPLCTSVWNNPVYLQAV